MRPPRQARSQQTLERVLDAGAKVFATGGYDGLTIAEVCRHASTSTGAVYARFENKDALVRAIHDHVMADMVAVVTALYAPAPEWDALTTPALIERAVRLLIDHIRTRADIVRAIVLRAAVDPVMRSSGAAAIREMADAFSTRVLDRRADYPHPDPQAAVREVFGMVFEATSWDIAFGREFREAGALGPPPDQRMPSIARMVLLTAPS